MSHIYKITENGENKLLVSKEYVDMRFKALREAIDSHIKNIDNAHTKNSPKLSGESLDKVEVEDLTSMFDIDISDPEEIKQDNNHRFITDKQLREMRSKASIREVQDLITDAKNELASTFNDQYIKLLNLPDALSKLREIAELCKDDVNLNTLLAALDKKINKEDLEMHEKDNYHVSAKDREALDLLVSKYDDGTLEELGTYSKMSHTADFSTNSGLLEGLELKDIRKGKREELIIGLMDDYPDGIIDVSLPGGCWLNKDIANLQLSNMHGEVLFKPGNYLIGDMRITRSNKYDWLTISGIGNSTYLVCEIFEFGENIIIKDCEIDTANDKNNCTVLVRPNTYFRNVKFRKCDINLHDTSFNRFENCTFDNCNIIFGKCRNIRFTGNDLINTKLPKYIGSNISYIDNMEIM